MLPLRRARPEEPPDAGGEAPDPTRIRMSTVHTTSAAPSAAVPADRSAAGAGPRPTTDDRRTRVRLRDLCDEVLASFRLASEKDLWTDGERREAQALLRGMAPVVALAGAR